MLKLQDMLLKLRHIRIVKNYIIMYNTFQTTDAMTNLNKGIRVKTEERNFVSCETRINVAFISVQPKLRNSLLTKLRSSGPVLIEVAKIDILTSHPFRLRSI